MSALHNDALQTGACVDRARGNRLSPAIIAVDGPAASGKTTIGRILADKLGYLFFDTGVMYRAITWAALKRGLDADDGEVLGELAETLKIDIVPAHVSADSAGAASIVLVDGQDSTAQLRTGAVDKSVSTVSAHARVRAAMGRQQRRVAGEYGTGAREKPGIVMVGRDIGSVIVPDAPVKIYLDATAEERARRRYAEMRAQGRNVDFAMVFQDVVRRDGIDSSRELAPLTVADGAVVVDTTKLTPEQVVARLLVLVQVAEDGE